MLINMNRWDCQDDFTIDWLQMPLIKMTLPQHRLIIIVRDHRYHQVYLNIVYSCRRSDDWSSHLIFQKLTNVLELEYLLQ